MEAAGECGGSSIGQSAFSATVYPRPANFGDLPVMFAGEASPVLDESRGKFTADQGHRRTETQSSRTGWFLNFFRKNRVYPEKPTVEEEETKASPRMLYIESRLAADSPDGNIGGVLYRGVLGDRPVAVKVVAPPENDGALAASLETRFVRETHVLSRLNHPNVIKILAAGRTQSGCPYIATEFRHGGGSLKDLLRRTENTTLDLTKVIDIVLGIARGMAHVHAEGIVHRELRSENILIEEGPSSCTAIIDGFGGACEEGRGGPVEARRRTAPEVIQQKLYDRGMDVHSFGLLLWEMLTAIVPFRKITASPVDLEVVLEEARFALEWLVGMCWLPSPEGRPDFSMIEEDLEKLASSVKLAHETAQ